MSKNRQAKNEKNKPAEVVKKKNYLVCIDKDLISHAEESHRRWLEAEAC